MISGAQKIANAHTRTEVSHHVYITHHSKKKAYCN
jgi:hypothetical protein